jgi:hypothetical protein
MIDKPGSGQADSVSADTVESPPAERPGSAALATGLKALYWLTPPVLGLLLYGRALTLPFFWDDVPLFQFLYDRPIAQFWFNASLSPYYRPVEFMIWRALQVAISPTAPGPFHAVNVLVWIINAWLVGALAGLLACEDRETIAWLASALLIVFPFAPQAIAWVSAISHPLVTLFTLSACVSLLRFERSRRRRWGAAAVAFAALAPFASESGTVTAGLMGLCWLISVWPVSDWQAGLRRKWPALAIIGACLLLNLAYLPIWASIPKDRSAGAAGGLDLQSVGQTATFFLEGLTYPVQFLARPLMTAGLSDLVAVIALGLLALAGAALLLRDRRWWLLGLGYCCLAGLPIMAALPFAYVITSPRLMSISAPAAALLWAAVAAESVRRIARPGPRLLAAAALATLAAATPAWHVVREIDLHHLALDQVWDLLREVQAHPNDKTLVINAVDWVAPVRATYALGHEGIEVMPGYTTPQLLVWAHTQKLYPVEAVTFPLVFPKLNDLYFATWGEQLDWNAMAVRARQAGRVLLVTYSDGAVTLRPAGRVLPAEGAAQVSFAGRLWLTHVTQALHGDTLDVSLTWRVRAASGEDIFANVVGCDGQVLGLSGGAGLGGVYPVWLWQPGETIEDLRHIRLDARPADGCYRLELGLFDPKGGARTEAYDSQGQRLPDDVFILESSDPGR